MQSAISLTQLKKEIFNKYNKSPIRFDGYILDYGKVRFGLVSVDDKWNVEMEDGRMELTTKELNDKLPELVGYM